MPCLTTVQQLQPELPGLGIDVDTLQDVPATCQPCLHLLDDGLPELEECHAEAGTVLKLEGFTQELCWTTAGSDALSTSPSLDENLASFSSFCDTNNSAPKDVSLPPNKLLHDWHGRQLHRFLKEMAERPLRFQLEIEGRRGGLPVNSVFRGPQQSRTERSKSGGRGRAETK
mmetsp:Transcript_66937/g.157796  ORF Transcript_66937/g.157796 Transcript_66937/m.157796 type:complete len:172 (-) Transcript_66937:132-647(-)